MDRERATEVRELPHEFEADEEHLGTGTCTLCKGRLLDARHVAWERAEEQRDLQPAQLPRERGV